MNKRIRDCFSRASIPLICVVILLSFFFLGKGYAAVMPNGPSSINVTANETSASRPGLIVNISGGYIATLNITTRSQNPHWKGFVGWINGKFALDDATGSTLFDWTTTVTTGEVFATRNSTSPVWTNIKCANTSTMEFENYIMNHSNADDNITKTFSNTTHSEFVVAGISIAANNCPALHTYKANETSNDFVEVAMWEGQTETVGTHIFATLLENRVTGFDSDTYDFQMIVPENGASTFTGATEYYVYVELG